MKRFLIVGLSLFCLLGLGACSHLVPATGALPDKERLTSAPQYRDGAFRNEVGSPPRPGGAGAIVGLIRNLFGEKERPAPSAPLPSVRVDLAALPAEHDVVVWLGHSSYYVQISGKRMLIDPVLSDYASPLPWMVKAFAGTTPYQARDLPEIDVILITHDHYDHLDYATMKDLEAKTQLVIAGIGNGDHLKRWGYPTEKIREMHWNSSVEIAPGILIHVLPAQHYSGRYTTRNQSLWASYALETSQRRLYFSGDTGFGPHFPEIAKRFGSFDFVALDAGQYNVRWSDIHMNPEEAASAAEMLGARMLLSGHAGRFSLARHAWDEPFERALAAAEGKRYRLLTPRIGEPVRLDDEQQTFDYWWRGIQ